MKRIETLDYLRGIMATLIMLYHYLFWSGQHFTSSDFFGRIGVYGVSIFYVLSGITLFVVYQNSIQNNFKSIISFFTKRIFRIFPLLWLVTFGTILIDQPTFNAHKLILNLTGAFGFVQPEAAMGNGVWSIGNELVFYSIFPILILALHFNKYLFIVFSAMLIAFSLYFTFFIMSPYHTLEGEWIHYINPINQIILFAGGMLIAYFIKPELFLKHEMIMKLILFAMIALFMFYPVSGDTINIVTGINRILFCCISFIICACVYVNTNKLPALITKQLSFVGRVSYSIYLLHALVYTECNKYLELSPLKIIFVSIFITFALSFIIYNYIESPMIKLGKKITTKYFINTTPNT